MERETNIKSISRSIPSLVIDEHNPSIMWATTFEEVTQTMQEMATRKSPCPNGFTIDFFQAC